MEKDLKDRLIVQTARIPEQGLLIKEDLPREWLTNIPEFVEGGETSIAGPIHVTGKAWMEGDNLRLKGEVAADLVTFCTRCGETMHYPLAGTVEVILIKGTETTLEDEEHELTPDETAAIYYNGVEADLAPFFQEEVAIQVPMQSLCRPDCAGLCALCGCNLNEKKCGCGEEVKDPRLAALRNLKLNS